MHALTGKVAIITGASSGIGRAAALLFAAEGAKVVLGARGRQRLDAVVDEIVAKDGAAIALAGDVGEEEYAKQLVDLAVKRFGGVDISFNNAGALGKMGETASVSAKEWNDALRVNLSSAFFAAKYQIPAMIERGAGSIIFTSTFVGHTAGFAGMASYAAGKSGLIGLTQSLAVELGARGIRVNALLPGGTDTPMAAEFANTPEAIAYVKGLHAMKRIASPEEIARSALYLASDASSFTTGTALLVDGGVSIARG
ncbi:MAG: SDR family oxidoreductase [Polyangiaceae bacterium]|nr:SDR family oxidoreductase [Polyangiaceae bacterium]